jgi:hypothetical protein
MDFDTVLELIRLLRMKMKLFLLNDDAEIVARAGIWVWAVLGKCRDRGELSSDDIGELRGLAQRAIGILEKLDGQTGIETGSIDLESEDSTEDASRSNAGVDTDRPARTGVDGDRTEQNAVVGDGGDEATGGCRLTRITLDMIITVVGEVYGQRDLLRRRNKWN